jgi:hypothetical protein
MPEGGELVQIPAPARLRAEPAPTPRRFAVGPGVRRGGGLAGAPGVGRIPSLTAVPLHPQFSGAPSAMRHGREDDNEQEAERLADHVAGLLPDRMDLGGVRIHSGQESARMTEALDAEAFAAGTDIHLAAGHPALTSLAGRRLVAHELVHLRQQALGAAPSGVPQAKPRKPRRPKGKTFRVTIDHTMGPDELLRTFVAQYYRITNPRELERVLGLWHWVGKPRSATEVDKARKYVQLTVHDVVDVGLGALDKKDRDAINAETDRRFFTETGLPPNTRLGTGPEDADLAARWRGVRANLVAEQEQARALNALPDDIKHILFAGGRQIQPEDYGVALDLADRIGRLSKAERARYLATVNASTTDLAELEKSIAQFEFHLRLRDFDAEMMDEAAADIFGLEELYDLWKAKRAAEMTAAVGFALTPEEETADAKFREALARSHFKTEAAFLAAIETYRKRFRTEAVNLAMDVLAGYDHLLYVAKLKFRDTDAATQLVGAIAASGAAADYNAAAEAETRASNAQWRMIAAARYGMPRADDIEEQQRASAEAETLRTAGSAKVVKASAGEPLIDPAVLGRKTDREKLTRLSAAGAKEYLLDLIADRLEDTARVRAELADDPERVFSQEPLVRATMQYQGIDDSTIYARIVKDHMQEIRDAHLFSAIVLGIIALVLAVLVPGGGWVAAAALVANAGISTWQAVSAIEEYNKAAPEYSLNFINDEPSLFWVGVAVVAAAFDLGLTAAQLLKASAPALKTLETPLREFATASDAETMALRLEQLNARIDAVSGLEKELADSIKAYAAAQLGLRRALGGTAKAYAIAGAVDPTPFFEALYYTVRKGSVTVTALRKESQLITAFGELAKVEGAGEGITTAFKRVKQIIKLGEQRHMDETTILKYVDRLAAERAGGEGAFEVLAAEMKGWRRPTAEQVAAEARLGEAHEQLLSLEKYQAELEAELASRQAGRIAGDPDRMTEIETELEWLSGKTSKGAASEAVGRGGGAVEKARAEFWQSMRLAEQARLDPKVLMRRAFAVSKERAAVVDAAKGVDQVGGLLTRPSGLHPDHIVSMQRMTQMDGFDKLRPLERQLLAVRADNLVAMDAAANLSKGERSWTAWRQASFFYPAETIEKMAAREAELYKTIQEWITKAVAGR